MRLLPVLVAGLVFATGLTAAPLCASFTTVAQLETAAVCQIGANLFNFDPGIANGFVGDGVVFSSDVTVAVAGMGFVFSGPFDANAAGGSAGYTIDYDVQGTGAYFTGATLSLTNLAFDFVDGGVASITKVITPTVPAVPAINLQLSAAALSDSTSALFVPNLQSFHVQDGINLNSGLSTNATLGSIGNEFTSAATSAVPEPGTFVLFGSTGLLIALFSLGRKKVRLARILPVLMFGLVAAVPSMHASPLCTGTLLSLAGSVCSVDGLDFTFGAVATEFPVLAGTYSPRLTAGDILVTAIESAAYGPGLQFSVGGTANATANNNRFQATSLTSASRTVTYNILYTVSAPVSILPGGIIGAKVVTAGGQVTNNAGFTSGGAWNERDESVPTTTFNLLTSNSTVSTNTSLPFTSTASIAVKNVIQLTAAAGATGSSASFTSFDNFYNVPEPETFALIGSALLGLGLMRRKMWAAVRN